MGEIKREPIVLVSPEGNQLECFDEDHTLNDICRWLLKNKVDAEEVHRMLGDELNAS